jgi:hypothetical protein
MFYPEIHLCILAPVYKLLESERTLEFGPILLRWRPNMWGFSATLAFCVKAYGLATFFIAHKNCIFPGASFETIKNLATLCAQKLQGFHGTPLYHCYTLIHLGNMPHSCRKLGNTPHSCRVLARLGCSKFLKFVECGLFLNLRDMPHSCRVLARLGCSKFLKFSQCGMFLNLGDMPHS